MNIPALIPWLIVSTLLSIVGLAIGAFFSLIFYDWVITAGLQSSWQWTAAIITWTAIPVLLVSLIGGWTFLAFRMPWVSLSVTLVPLLWWVVLIPGVVLAGIYSPQSDYRVRELEQTYLNSWGTLSARVADFQGIETAHQFRRKGENHMLHFSMAPEDIDYLLEWWGASDASWQENYNPHLDQPHPPDAPVWWTPEVLTQYMGTENTKPESPPSTRNRIYKIVVDTSNPDRYTVYVTIFHTPRQGIF